VTTATIIGALLLVLAFSPLFSSVTLLRSSADGCAPTWNIPSGNFPSDSSLSFSVTFTCNGDAGDVILIWTVTDLTTQTKVENGDRASAPGSYGSGVGLDQLQDGNYEFSIEYIFQSIMGSSSSGTMTTYFNIGSEFYAPEFPLGSILAILVPLGALIGYSMLRKSSFPKLNV
jgi:hypothetical protein